MAEESDKEKQVSKTDLSSNRLKGFLNIGSLMLMALGCLNYIPLGLIELDVINAALGWHPVLARAAYTIVALSFLYMGLPLLLAFWKLIPELTKRLTSGKKGKKGRNPGILVVVLVAFVLVAIGCLNYGVIGVFDFNPLAALLAPSPLLLRIVYLLIGLAGPTAFCACFWD